MEPPIARTASEIIEACDHDGIPPSQKKLYPAEAFVYKFRWCPDKNVGDDGNGNPTDVTSDDDEAQKKAGV